MLKAVRFDEEKHKLLLKWIEEFRDAKGRQNESEAVRYLMQLGYESLMTDRQEVRVAGSPEPEPVQAVTEPKSEIDRGALKRELMDEVMAEINVKMLGGLTAFVDKLNNLQVQPQVVQIPVVTPLPSPDTSQEKKKTPEPPPKPKRKSSALAVEGNALLANLLGNADR